MRGRRGTTLSLSPASLTPPSMSTSLFTNNKEGFDMPPLSPLLPLAIMKENSSKHTRDTRFWNVLRSVLVLCALGALWIFVPVNFSFFPYSGTFDENGLHNGTEFVLPQGFPEEPAVVQLTAGDRKKWTIYILPSSSFPLQRHEYQKLSGQCEAVPASLPAPPRRCGVPSHYIDVNEAESAGILPGSKVNDTNNICGSSITFVFDEEEVSFGKSLLLLWMSYGLAKLEGRAFFIDDSRWSYGSYSSYFVPVALPGCSPPPPQHIVPCPRNAAHLVISAATAPSIFGQSFDCEFMKSRRFGSERSRRIYKLLRAGYEELFHLAEDDSVYVAARVAEMKEEAQLSSAPLIGVHVRRGDRHPVEYEYSRDYLPLERYTKAARDLSRAHTRPQLLWRPRLRPTVTEAPSVPLPLVLASDDPVILTSEEFQHEAAPLTVYPAQTRIQLATKAALDDVQTAPSSRRTSNDGWEGGFYKALFHSLGLPTPRQAGGTHATMPSEQGLRLRNLLGRAYLLDIAVLAQADGVVCAVSSATCRVLGVMMGWDAIRDQRWLNVDDGRLWSWDGRQ